MKRIKLLCALSFLSFPWGLGAQNFIFTEQYSARPVGMGNCFTALADDSTAVFYNPAGLNQIENQAFQFMYADLHSLGLVGNYIFSGAVRYNEDIGMGLGWSYERVNLEPEIWSQHNIIYGISYNIFRRIALGASAKALLFNTDFEGYKNIWGYGFDAGLLISSEDRDIRFLANNNIIAKIGFFTRNLYSRIKWDDANTEELPFELALGVSVNYANCLNASLEVKGLEDRISRTALGVELFLFRIFRIQLDEMYKITDLALRAGMKTGRVVAGSTDYSLGLGIMAETMSFDYAVALQSGYFNPTHYLSLNMRVK